MQTEPQPYVVPPDSELAHLLEREGTTLLLENNGVRYRVVRDTNTTPDASDPWANYDPEKMIAAIHASAGMLKGLDVEAFLKEIYEAREQDTPGRPA